MFFSLLSRKKINKMDQEEDFGLISVREALNSDKIKLWLAPYYEENVDTSESLNTLAETLHARIRLPKENIINYLKILQEKSLTNLKERQVYEESGLASLKIRAPRRIDTPMNLKIALSSQGKELKTRISEFYQIPCNRLKLISQGQLIKEDVNLTDQGLKHGSQIMTLLLTSSPEEMAEFETNNAVLNKTRRDVQYLSSKNNKDGDFYLQIADQSGKQLDLPKKERRALVMAMTLHEKGRTALKREKFDLALLLLLEAEQEFKQCTSQLLQHVDNYGLLSLDLTWCYLNLCSISQLPNAQVRLEECEKNFHKSYGPNLERLAALKGAVGNEAALFLRLHLLQGIVLYHQGKLDAAKKLFDKVEMELKELKVDEQKVNNLVEVGYSAHDARLALRQAKGDVDLAATVIENKLAELERVRKLNERERDLKNLQEKLGKCKDGRPVDVELHASLVSMGYEFEIGKSALAETNNRLDDALTMIQEQPEKLLQIVTTVDDSQVAQIVAMGFESSMAIAALRKHCGNLESAVEELSENNGVVQSVEFSNEASTSKKKIKTEKERNMEAKAFKRVADGIDVEIDDYLDLALTAEEAFLRKYQSYIADAYQTPS